MARQPGETKQDYDRRINEVLERMRGRKAASTGVDAKLEAESNESEHLATKESNHLKPDEIIATGADARRLRVLARSIFEGREKRERMTSQKLGLGTAQRVVLLIGALAIAGMCLYPPWNEEHELLRESSREPTQAKVTRPAGYHLLLKPPPLSHREGFWPIAVRIDPTRLAIQCFVVAMLTGGLTIVLRRSNR